MKFLSMGRNFDLIHMANTMKANKLLDDQHH